MYEINLKNAKKGYKYGFIFTGIGIFFAGIVLFPYFFTVNKMNSMDASTMSTRVEITSEYDYDSDNMMYTPIYYYNVDGMEYVCSSSISYNIMPSTENKLVYYNSEQPSSCMSEYAKTGIKWFLLFAIMPVIFIAVGLVFIIKTFKKVKIIGELNNTGKLVKNLPYYLENTYVTINNRRLQRIVVEYELPNGSYVKLKSDPRNDGKEYDDGFVDLLIDENNPDNYYIDFEINRLSGNLESDYYEIPSTKGISSDNNSVQNSDGLGPNSDGSNNI